MNPRIGSGMQQAHEPSVEQTVGVVRNHEDGTCAGLGSPAPTAPRNDATLSREERNGRGSPEWTPVVMSMEG
jgi:hypothetical protein